MSDVIGWCSVQIHIVELNKSTGGLVPDKKMKKLIIDLVASVQSSTLCDFCLSISNNFIFLDKTS